MSKPNVKKVEPRPEAGGAADAPKAKRSTPDWKLPPAQRAVVVIGKLIDRVTKVESGRFSVAYNQDLAEALKNSRDWLKTARGHAEKLPQDFRPPKAARVPGAPRAQTQIAVGALVTLRDKRRETYAGILSPEELTKGVPVKGVHGNMLSVETSRGVSFLPKAHLKQVEATAAQ